MKIKITKADKIFSQYIRTKAGWRCERCFRKYPPGTSSLHCSHFFGRGKRSVRFDEENANAHCFGCHQYLGANPAEFYLWKKRQIGQTALDALMIRANQPTKVDEALVVTYYTEKLKKLGDRGIKDPWG